jgi:hypothetical protein
MLKNHFNFFWNDFFRMLIRSDAGDLHYEAKTKIVVEVVGLDEYARRGVTFLISFYINEIKRTFED